MSTVLGNRGGTAPADADWSIWSTRARLVVTDSTAMPDALVIVNDVLAEVERACSRFRPDSELSLLQHAPGRWHTVLPMLRHLLEVSLAAARSTDGAVDPTVGSALIELGYDVDLSLVQARAADRRAAPTSPAGAQEALTARRVPGWHRVLIEEDRVFLPEGVVLDLGATGKAAAADLCATTVWDRLGVGVLVSLGGDIATGGPAPDGGWLVEVRDLDDPTTTVALPGGAALATSSSISRRWRHGGSQLHHVLDPSTGLPPPLTWRTVSVSAWTCARANALSTASIARPSAALVLLRSAGVPARLVSGDGAVITLGRWPEEVAT